MALLLHHYCRWKSTWTCDGGLGMGRGCFCQIYPLPGCNPPSSPRHPPVPPPHSAPSLPLSHPPLRSLTCSPWSIAGWPGLLVAEAGLHSLACCLCNSPNVHLSRAARESDWATKQALGTMLGLPADQESLPWPALVPLTAAPWAEICRGSFSPPGHQYSHPPTLCSQGAVVRGAATVPSWKVGNLEQGWTCAYWCGSLPVKYWTFAVLPPLQAQPISQMSRTALEFHHCPQKLLGHLPCQYVEIFAS